MSHESFRGCPYLTPRKKLLSFYPQCNGTTTEWNRGASRGEGSISIRRGQIFFSREFPVAYFSFICTSMGKSHDLHCEVQLLDDQSTTVDLDVSFFCFAKALFLRVSKWWLMLVCVASENYE